MAYPFGGTFEAAIKFTLLDYKQPTRVRRVRAEENIAAVSSLNYRRRSQEFCLWSSQISPKNLCFRQLQKFNQSTRATITAYFW